ncbi:ornithine decarboxylase 1-like [Mercenaria mercenaria]|uniref:ornithine decarboxylase 1-like n=1 Tax=Mercenaria mercenaria TaxID=6596 RepID=UPI00234F9392|nr:ornithine decarboxylase 1-like [Mercenaria mercenaria]
MTPIHILPVQMQKDLLKELSDKAVKCNRDEVLLQVLSDMGASFDCASKKEIEAVLHLGVSPTRIVYAHPCKPVSSLIFAKSRDVSLVTFDNVNELKKVKETYPSARLLLRLLPEKEFNARLQFSGRYGCSSTEVRHILQTAKDLDLNIVGVCFHVGSDIQEPRAYVPILQQSRSVFDIARRMGFNMNILDIGGGFPGEQNTFERFKEITEVINETLLDLFPPEDNVEIIAEPGRYIAASAFTVVASIVSKRCYQSSANVNGEDEVNRQDSAKPESKVTTYSVNDSVFGNFMFGWLYKPGSVIYIPKVVKATGDNVGRESTVIGCTLAPGDIISVSVMLPNLDVGDWIYYEDMGAYTLSTATRFNGLDVPAITYHCLEELWYQVYPDSKIEEDSVN